MTSAESLSFNNNHTNAVLMGQPQLDNAAYLDPLPYFPTTISLIVLMHAVFLHQMMQRIPRKNLVVTYQSIIHHKRFHKLWLALLSHPAIPETGAQGSLAEARRHEAEAFAPLVGMGGPIETGQWHGNNTPQIMRTLTEWGQRQWKRLTQGSLSGFPLLLYNSHVLWSCRALEQVFNNQDAWRYARFLVALGLLGVTIELGLCHALVQAILRRQHQSGEAFGEIQPSFDGPLDASALEQLRQRAEKRAIGTMTTLASAILVLFHFQYWQIPLAVLPFFTDRFLSRYPGITYLACLAVLTMLARYIHPMGVVTGALAGLLWIVFSLDFLADAGYGNWLVLVALFLTLLSWKGRAPHLLPCIEYISWYDPDLVVAMEDSATRPLSWCLQPVLEFDEEEASSSSLDVNTTDDDANREELEFTRVRSGSDAESQDVLVDPDLWEQGRRPRRTRIQSHRL